MMELYIIIEGETVYDGELLTHAQCLRRIGQASRRAMVLELDLGAIRKEGRAVAVDVTETIVNQAYEADEIDRECSIALEWLGDPRGSYSELFERAHRDDEYT